MDGGAATGAGVALGRGGGVYVVLGGSSSRFLFHIRGVLRYQNDCVHATACILSLARAFSRFCPRLKQNGRTAESKLPSNLVDQVALVGKVQRRTLICEHHELRWADGGLGHVEDLSILEVQRLDEPVQLPRSHAL